MFSSWIAGVRVLKPGRYGEHCAVGFPGLPSSQEGGDAAQHTPQSATMVIPTGKRDSVEGGHCFSFSRCVSILQYLFEWKLLFFPFFLRDREKHV